MAKWNDYYRDKLRLLYPTSAAKTIIDALDGKFSWNAIQQEASKRSIHRIGWGIEKTRKSRYTNRGYCPACAEWFHHSEIPDDLRCPNEDCNQQIRLPSVKSWRRRKKKKK